MTCTSVTALRPSPAPGEGLTANALRQRRWRQRKAILRSGVLPHVYEHENARDINKYNQSARVTHERRSVTVSTADMCGLAARLENGVTAADLELASRLILELVGRLPADSTLTIALPERQP